MLEIKPKIHSVTLNNVEAAELIIIRNPYDMVMELRFTPLSPVGESAKNILEWTNAVLEQNNHTVYTIDPTIDGITYHFLHEVEYTVVPNVLKGYYSVIVCKVVSSGKAPIGFSAFG